MSTDELPQGIINNEMDPTEIAEALDEATEKAAEVADDSKSAADALTEMLASLPPIPSLGGYRYLVQRTGDNRKKRRQKNSKKKVGGLTTDQKAFKKRQARKDKRRRFR